MDYSATQKCWLYLRPNCRRELKVRDYFDSRGTECFVPMHKVVRVIHGKEILMDVPVMGNMVFVKTSYENMLEAKSALEALGIPVMLRMDSVIILVPLSFQTSRWKILSGFAMISSAVL